MPKNLRLETRRLVIRPFTMADAPAFFHLVSDPEVTAYIPLDPMPLERVTDMFRQRIQSYDSSSLEEFNRETVAICLKDSGKMIGWCGLGRLEIETSEIEVYYGLGKTYWGQGFATEAAGAMVNHGFLDWNLGRIVAIVFPENNASRKVLEKIGMRYEKKVTGLPEKHKYFEGVLFFALSREEFLAHKRAGM